MCPGETAVLRWMYALHTFYIMAAVLRCMYAYLLYHGITVTQMGQFTCGGRDGVGLVDRPTQLICISDIYLSTDKYKRHSRPIC